MAIRKPKITEPVLPDQGGRITAVDPMHSAHTPQDELVRRKAFELYEQRGRIDGMAVDDWLEAESQLGVDCE